LATRQAVEALRKNKWTGNATNLESFVFDVYALDFGEEGAGLHGILVQQQSDMVAEAIHFLVQTCQFDRITIVAHSIGGYAARLALVEYPDLQKIVRHLITLGTPHTHPVLAIDLSLHRIHARLNTPVLPLVTTISISGGLRDEMIPPDSTPSNSAINILASDIMDVGETTVPLLGMDHRAIVWCHNLLSPVRRILFALSRSTGETDDPSTKLLHLAEILNLPMDYDYVASLRQMRLAATVSHHDVYSMRFLVGVNLTCLSLQIHSQGKIWILACSIVRTWSIVPTGDSVCNIFSYMCNVLPSGCLASCFCGCCCGCPCLR
jgi:hypothetical protein